VGVGVVGGGRVLLLSSASPASGLWSDARSKQQISGHRTRGGRPAAAAAAAR
jgi:hypothetical protein